MTEAPNTPSLASNHDVVNEQPIEESHVQRLNRRLLMADQAMRLRSPGQLKIRLQGRLRPRVAIVSLLFNWPSTAGGIVHTAELSMFLAKEGYDVCHIYAVNEQWEVGQVRGELQHRTHALVFDSPSWDIENVTRAFRDAVDAFKPTAVIITDSWNSKPQIALAMDGYKYYLRIAAMECICPLNNVRLLIDENGSAIQCSLSQLTAPGQCLSCVDRNERFSGWLQRRERDFSRFRSVEYAYQLQSAFAKAEGILVVNPTIAELCRPHSKAVHVIPSGFDKERFADLPEMPSLFPFRILFAGVVDEYMKGFHVLVEACRRLWVKRQDFELIVTADQVKYPEPFIRCEGWQTQQSLPLLIAHCHIVVVPTLAQEALGRTAVEAMGASRAVVASKIGGLEYTVSDEVTGLLVDPGNSDALVAALERLMEDLEFTAFLGRNGRSRFDTEFVWESIIKSKYAVLLGMT